MRSKVMGATAKLIVLLRATTGSEQDDLSWYICHSDGAGSVRSALISFSEGHAQRGSGVALVPGLTQGAGEGGAVHAASKCALNIPVHASWCLP